MSGSLEHTIATSHLLFLLYEKSESLKGLVPHLLKQTSLLYLGNNDIL